VPFPGPGPDDHAEDDLDAFFTSSSAPLPPDDRLWRHPSELEPPPPRTPARRSGASTWAAALAAGMAGALVAVGALAVLVGFEEEEEEGVRPAVIREVSQPVRRPAGGEPDVVGIAESVGPAIARIDVRGDSAASGSGVVFRDDGYLLTNAHVVEGADQITAVLADASELTGEVVGADPLTDVAVVKVERRDPFPTAALGSATELRVGEAAIAIGSPLGLTGGSSVTTGVVSALGREVEGEDGSTLVDMVQTDAAISPGSSGGALLDGSGAVVGITTAIAVSEVGAEGLGFATPIDIARSVAEEIIETGRAVHVWLGIQGEDLDSGSADRLGVRGGAVIQGIVAGSPAEDAGLSRRDVILSVGSEDVTSMAGLVIALRDLDPGQEVDLEVARDGRRSTVPITLEERPTGS
jgi:serine protease Do